MSTNPDIRESVIAGSWYPGKPAILKRDVESYLSKVPTEEVNGEIIGFIAPHAGYMYSGQVAAYSYKYIVGKTFDSVLVIGPSHRVHFKGVSVYDRGGYQTPLGVVPVDTVLAKKIASFDKMISFIPDAHLREHSIEIQLPFLQVVLGRFDFVPLIMGDQSIKTCDTLAKSIYEAIFDKNVLIIASSDLSHFHDYDKATKLDRLALSKVLSMDESGLLEALGKDMCEACGGGPMAVAIMLSKKMKADGVKLLKYANSGDVTGDRTSVVGYASVVFFKRYVS